MKTPFLLIILLFSSMSLSAQWKPMGDKIKTAWAEKIDPNNVLPEYPRPIMERDKWQNLNGLGVCNFTYGTAGTSNVRWKNSCSFCC